MSGFSAKERLIAGLLSSTPALKSLIKRVYVTISYITHKKNYKIKYECDDCARDLRIVEPRVAHDETFFGYYDKSPMNCKGYVIYYETARKTRSLPSSRESISIYVTDINNKNHLKVAETLSYNWQQGARAQWIDDSRLIYNFFDGKSYRSAVFDTSIGSLTDTYALPVQDAFKDRYFLAVNYERIMRLRPDYGYRNLPLISNQEMKALDADGIWKVDMGTKESKLIVSLGDIIKISRKSTFDDALHKVNHVMISPDGEKFIFIHRWYTGKQRHDRLMLSNFKDLTVLADENMVSHMCWFDNTTLFGYLRYEGKDGFYFIDITTGHYRECNALSSLGYGDGHPTCHGEWIAVDTYPDKSRMQHLFLYNCKTDTVVSLLEVFHSIRYQGESRCDLHPRFSPDGEYLLFDTLFKGSRRLVYLNISSIVK